MAATTCDNCIGSRSRYSPDGLCIACARFQPLKAFGNLFGQVTPSVAPPDAAGRNLGRDIAHYLADHPQQQQLASRVGASQATISRLKDGKIPLTGKTTSSIVLRLADLFGTSPARYGVVEAADDDATQGDLVQTFRQARSLRTLGQPETAYSVLTATRPGMNRHRDILARSTLAEYWFALGFTLTDLSEFQGLFDVADCSRRAFRYLGGEVTDSASAYICSQLGNQLRMAHQTDEARAYLSKALLFKRDPSITATVAPLLAKLESTAHRPQHFEAALKLARGALERSSVQTSLINDFALTEIEARGAIRLGQLPRARRVIDTVDKAADIAASPQWRIIFQVTSAELYLAEGRVADAYETARGAIRAAEQFTLPRQLDRIEKLLKAQRREDEEIRGILVAIGQARSRLQLESGQRDSARR